MEKIGVSFRSLLSPDEVRSTYVSPLQAAQKRDNEGIYTNYLRQVDPDAIEPTEHLLVFEVNDFKSSLRSLRLELEKIGAPENLMFQNLNPSQPGY